MGREGDINREGGISHKKEAQPILLFIVSFVSIWPADGAAVMKGVPPDANKHLLLPP